MARTNTGSKILTFLKRLNNNQDISHILCYGDRMEKCECRTNIDNVRHLLFENTKRHVDAYFYVNGASKEQDIERVVACFVDLDAGRDPKTKKYLSTREVNRKKKKMMYRVSECPIRPNFIVETRNGYQLYWLIEPTVYKYAGKEKWILAQQKINSFFRSVGADHKVVKANQIMRVPYTTWYKPKEGKEPFEVSLVKQHNARYELDVLVNKLQDVEITKPDPEQETSFKWFAYWGNTPDKKFVDKKVDVTKEETNGNNQELLQACIDFLYEVASTMNSMNKRHSAKVAINLAKSLMSIK